MKIETIGNATLYLGDCREILPTLPGCDLILTDPPYYSTNLVFDQQEKIDFKALMLDLKAVLKPAGVLVSFADFNILAELRSYQVFKTSYELIWHKTMAVGFLHANLRPLRDHEYIGVFTDALKKSTYNPQKKGGGETYKKNRKGVLSDHYATERTNSNNSSGIMHPRSVLKFSNGNNYSEHPTQKPDDLCEYLILTYSNPKESILDPFMGSGTTGVAAIKMGKLFTGIEREPKYFDIACRRIEEATKQPDIFGFDMDTAPEPCLQNIELEIENERI